MTSPDHTTIRIIDPDAPEPYPIAPEFAAQVAWRACRDPSFWKDVARHVVPERLPYPGASLILRACRDVEKLTGIAATSESAVLQAIGALQDRGLVTRDERVAACAVLEDAEERGVIAREQLTSQLAEVVKADLRAGLVQQMALDTGKHGKTLAKYATEIDRIEAIGADSAGADTGPARALDLHELAAIVGEKIDYVVDGVIPRRAVTLLAGPFLGGKSRTAATLAACVSTGSDWCGRAVTQGPVLWVGADRGLQSAYATISGALEGAEPGAQIRTWSDPSWSLDDSGKVRAVREYVAAAGVELLVVDCLRAVTNADENSATEMRKAMKVAQSLATTCAVVVLHHAGHEGTRARGSTDIGASSEVQILLSRSGDVVTLDVHPHAGARFKIRARDIQRDGGFRLDPLDSADGAASPADREADINVAIRGALLEEDGRSTAALMTAVRGRGVTAGDKAILERLATLAAAGFIREKKGKRGSRCWHAGASWSPDTLPPPIDGGVASEARMGVP